MPVHISGKTLALMYASIGTHRSKRPLSPIEVSRNLEVMKEELDDKTHKQLAKRFQCSQITIKQFIDLLKAPKRYEDVWGWGMSKGGRISWSQFREACYCYGKKIITEDEFGALVSGVLNGQIDPSDVREIVRLKNKNPGKSFKECCIEIHNLVPETIKSFLFIADLDRYVLESIRIRAHRASLPEEKEAEHVLSKHLGAEHVEGVTIENDKHIKIALTEQGRKNLGSVAQNDGKTLVDVVNHIFTKSGYGNE